MRAIVFAYQELGYICLEQVLNAGFDVAAVITHHDNPGEEIWFRSVARLAESRGIPVWKTDSFNKDEWFDRIRAVGADVFFSFMFRKMIHSSVLALAPKGAFNLHPSLLPKYRGRCPANWVLVNGERETGLTLHRMVKSADAGAIVAQTRVEITPEDDVRSLYAKFAAVLPEFIFGAVTDIRNGTYKETTQDDSSASLYGGRGPQDGVIDWSGSALSIHNLVRAVAHPYPGAFAVSGKGEKLFIWKTEPPQSGSASSGKPGTVLRVSPLEIECGQGFLSPKILQWKNEAELSAPDFVRQYNVKAGDLITERSALK
ncbi:MAG: formyltransferase [Elusimicrobiaceae bacterium]